MRLSTEEEKRLVSLSVNEKNKEREEIKKNIVMSPKDCQLVLSGAGTGKTSFFIDKTEYWINKKGLQPEKIMVASFVNFIVDDLKNKLNQGCMVCTLHKLAKTLIHKYLGMGKNFPKNKITNNFYTPLRCDKENLIQDILWLRPDITKSKNELLDELDNCLQSKIKPATDFLEDYFKLAGFYDAVTFDDSILRAIRIMSDVPGIIDVQKIIIDEYQDFNKAEQELVEKLFEKATGGIIAGDDDQSIYSGKNARPNGIRNLYKLPKWENNCLPFCSRCKSAAIVECAAEICRRQISSQRVDKTFLPLEDNGKKVKIVPLSQSKSSPRPQERFLIEAEYIAKQITDDNKIQGWKEDYPAYLVLGLKNRRHLIKIANVLKEKFGADKVDIKKIKPLDDREVQVLFSYIQLLENPKANLPFRRLLSISNVLEKEKERLFLTAFRNGGFGSVEDDFIKSVFDMTITLNRIIASDKNVEEKLANMIKKLELSEENPNLKAFIESIKNEGFGHMLDKIENMVIDQKGEDRKETLFAPIQCLTIHSSKGLKADTVFVLGLEDGYLPKSNDGPSDEEIRLLYVAMTRAVNELYLLRCIHRFDGVHNTNGKKNPSVFLDWLPKKLVEDYNMINKDDLT
jgi:DNA helicase-2/ATP-dependent DNA helicase PcrA